MIPRALRLFVLVTAVALSGVGPVRAAAHDEEIAAMAAYLASDEAASVIGAVMVVDGGATAR